MKAINHKLWRETWHLRGQVIAIALILACGVSIFVMSLSTIDSLQNTQENYYETQHFAEVFANLKRAPENVKARIQDIPGEQTVETRVLAGVNVELAGFNEPITGILVSIPDDGQSLLNRLLLREGRLLEPHNDSEIVISESFAEAHKLKPGDHLTIIINGKRKLLTIVGTASSPEFIYQIAPGALIPDYKRYGVFWMGRSPLSSAYDMEGAFNNISLTITPGAKIKEVIDKLDVILEPYGGLGAYERKDQLSHRFLSEEFKQLRTTATILPIIFLGVAAFLLNVVLSRLIRIQRQEIAIMKAFGYSNFDVGIHYLKQVMVIVILGFILGLLLGIWTGRGLGNLYMEFFRFPYLLYKIPVYVIVTAFLVTAGAAVSGTLHAVSVATLLPPAIAMRPEQPVRYRESFIERIGIKRFLLQPTRMIIRHLERSPVKSIFISLGIAFATSILIVGSYSDDAIDYEMGLQFNQIQREDLAVSFNEPTSYSSLYEIQSLPGVFHTEVFRSVPVRFRHEYYTYLTSIQGMQPNGELSRLINTDLEEVKIPPEGIILTDYLGKLLHVKEGDSLTVEVLEGSRPKLQIPVTGLISQFLGVGGYMDINALNRMMKEGYAVSGAYLKIDPVKQQDILDELKERPRVAAVSISTQVKQNLYETFGENLLIYTFILTLFAGVLVFGVVYNSARISLSERGREMASLRVLGFTRAEISYLLLGELAVITLIAIPAGFLIGYGITAYFAEALSTDLYRMPLVLNRDTYAFAATVVIISATISGLIVRHRIDHLDLIGVLKTRE
jgi:putative ABC transport system permease protein